MSRQKKERYLLRILRESQVPARLLILSALSVAALYALSVVESYFFGVVIDASGLGVDEILKPVIIIVSITMGEYVASIADNYFSSMAVETAFCNLRVKAAVKTAGIDYLSLTKMTTGDLMSRMMGDLNTVGEFWRRVFLEFFGSMMVFVIGFFICLRVSVWLTILGFVFVPVVFFVNLKVSKPAEAASGAAREAEGAVVGLLRNIITGVAAVKAYSLYTRMRQKFAAALDTYVRAETRLGKIQALMEPVSGLLYFIPMCSVMIGGGVLIAGDQLTSGMYITFIFTFGWVSWIIHSIKDHMLGFRRCEASAKRVCELLDIPAERLSPVKDVKATESLLIEIDNVSFSYSGDGGGETLKNVTLQVHKNEVVAVVGQSGSGKSTLVKLIYGLFAPNGGRVSVAGLDLCEENLASIRHKVSVVSQDNFLFPDTILNNLRMGNDSATEADIIKACENAGIHDFIAALPDGYQSVVGEKGCNLSGGQRQRLCIARAFLHDREILILDEPTSALDALTESLLWKSLTKLMRDKTVVMVTHRLANAELADKIVVMENGCVAETGTHDALMARCGLYRAMRENREERGA